MTLLEVFVVLGLFGKKSDHPLADMKSAQLILDDVPRNDPFKALQELGDWVEAIREEAKNFRLDHQWAVLRLFDQAAQPYLRKLLCDYFSVQSLSQFQENRLWTLLERYLTQSELCHFDVLTRYRKGEKGASSVKPDLTLLCARGISANTGRLKLAAARYTLVEPWLWEHLAGYYGLAEAQNFQDELVSLYPGVNSTVAQEFAVLMVWYGSSAGTLSPLQEHITERLFAHLGKGLQISKAYNASGLFIFDLAQPTPPMRASLEITLHPSLRYFDAEAMKPQLDSLIKTLDKGILPENFNLYGAKYESEMLRDFAQRLLQSLVLPAPMRRSPRRKINVNLKVASGFFRMLEKTDVGPNFDEHNGEIWDVEDISASGFRSVIPMSRADGIKIGTLLGSRPESVSHWGAGVVRRLSRDKEGNLHVGVEILSHRFVGVPLKDQAQPGAESDMAGIYLNRPSDTSGEAWLLMKPEIFSASRSMTMQMDGKEYLLLPLALVEHGHDYDLARYRMMEQDGIHEEE
ncbi:MAG: hypothetical protein PHQ60_11640 [Sideroxydans sp.]|nr:hypothetical protein [Sideroxydans sp.]